MSIEQSIDLSFAQRPHILVVDDDPRICALLLRYLSEHGFLVVSAKDALEARALLRSLSFDLVVLDVMMPGESGLELAVYLREHYSALPILLLTALGEAGDRIAGLQAGADDYLAKPFEPQELLLRLNSILRRTVKPLAPSLKPFHIGRWLYDPALDELQDRASTETLKLTAGEGALLAALGARAGEIMSREALAQACDLDSGERTIDVQVTRLRRKIEDDTKNPRYLRTVRGKGYVLRLGEGGS